MGEKRLKFLFIQPDYPRQYVFFFPVYEPLHGLLFGAIIRDLAETRLFDRRFDTDANLARLVRDYQPDLVGVTTHTAGEIFNVKRLLGIVKRECPQAVTIVGGQHSSLLPEDLFDPTVDLVCIGPGEETFREAAELLASKGSGADFSAVPGLAVRAGDSYVITPPRLPHSGSFSWPKFDRSLLRGYKWHYLNHFEYRPVVYTITTSGCPYRCKFCSLWAVARGTYRRRQPEEIVEDIISQPQKYVHLTDDNTFHNEDHALEIYRLLKKSGVKKKILAYARTDRIAEKPELLAKWREIGLGALVVGMEACSDKYLELINKKTSLDVNIQAQKIMDRLGIESWAHFVIMPAFQKEDFDGILDFIERLGITYPIFVPMTPVAGTPMFFEAKDQGQLSVFDYGYYNLQYMVMKTTLPKREWYDHMMRLYTHTCSWRTLWRRRKSPAFHLRPALGRAIIMGRCVRKLDSFVQEQLETERTVRYEDIEPTLPPSLRRDYKPVNYYNAPTLAAANEALSAAAVAGGG